MQVIFDPQKMFRDLTIFEQKDLPSMSVIALNRALFNTRKDLGSAAKQIFDRPVPFTVKSFLYKKAKFGTPEAEIFIRDQATKGTAPADYLLPQIVGDKHKATRFQGQLLNTVVMNAYGTPVQVGKRALLTLPAIPKGARQGVSKNKVRVNKYGNMSPGQFSSILSSLRGGISSADVQETGPTVKPQDAGPNTKYVYLDEESLDHDYFANRGMRSSKPGIYFIRHLGAGRAKKGGSAWRKEYYRVMTEQTPPFYAGRFNFQDTATILVRKNFISEFEKLRREKRSRF